MIECKLKKLGFADEYGNVKNIDEAKMNEKFPLTEGQKTIISNANKNCTEYLSQPNELIDKFESKCNGNAFKHTICLRMHLIATCPSDKRSNHPHCMKMRKFTEIMHKGTLKSDEELPGMDE